MHEQRATVRLLGPRTGLRNQAPHLGADQFEASLQRGVLAFVFVEGADLRALVVGEQGIDVALGKCPASNSPGLRTSSVTLPARIWARALAGTGRALGIGMVQRWPRKNAP